jgi:hypothetical protein
VPAAAFPSASVCATADPCALPYKMWRPCAACPSPCSSRRAPDPPSPAPTEPCAAGQRAVVAGSSRPPSSEAIKPRHEVRDVALHLLSLSSSSGVHRSAAAPGGPTRPSTSPPAIFRPLPLLLARGEPFPDLSIFFSPRFSTRPSPWWRQSPVISITRPVVRPFRG